MSDPDFEILVRECDKKKKDDCREDWIGVSEREYNDLQVGDYWKG